MNKIAFNSKSNIIKGLRKKPCEVIANLQSLANSDEDAKAISLHLDQISLILEKISAKQDGRRNLSRQIGTAKKKNEDYANLIKQVSEISVEIDSLNVSIEDHVSEINKLITTADENKENKKRELPEHLMPKFLNVSNTNPLDAINEFSLDHNTPLDVNEWQKFVEQNPHGTVYHAACWKEIIFKNFKNELLNITCRDESGSLVGVLHLCHLRSFLFGSYTVSIPYFNYGGPIATSAAAEDALLSYAANLSHELGCSHMEIREVHSRKNWASVQRKVSMVLPLPNCDNELEKHLGSKLRAQVKKAGSNGLRVQFGTVELVDHFYDVFSHNMRDLGTPVYCKQFFTDILNNFPDSAFIAIVYHGDVPLAAGFLLGYRDKLEIPWASSIRSENHLGSNMFMYRSILREAISRKYSFFDFGRSTPNSTTYNFKKQWGAFEHLHHWHYWTRNGEDVPQLNPDNPKYKLAINAWQKLPIFLTKILGPKISKNLP